MPPHEKQKFNCMGIADSSCNYMGKLTYSYKKALIKLDPFEIGALRLTLASFVLFPFLAKNLKEIRRKDYLILFISGIVGNVLPYFLYPIAQTKIDSATSGVLTSLTPFLH